MCETLARRGLRAGIAACFACVTASAQAQVTYVVTFDDPEGLLSTSAPAIESHIQAAGRLWSERLDGISELWIRVHPDTDLAGIHCRAFTWSYRETIGGIDTFETCAATHIRNGFPASSFDPDIEIAIDPAFLTNTVWFEPDALVRTGEIDPAKLDGVSLFIRGLGKCFAFSGWTHETNGTLPSFSASTFDRLIVFDGTDFSFVGPDAMAAYGGPVPLTFGGPFGVGNLEPRPGQGLVGDAMNGVGQLPGVKYTVSELDWMMLRDAYVPVRYACPCDINGDGFIDDADFTIFGSDYNTLDCADPSMPSGCPSDFNVDAFVDDADYVIFVDMYAAFICP